MTYKYENHRNFVFTEEGQLKLLSVVGKARVCLELAGAVKADVLLKAAGGGDSWSLMAVVERLVELEYLRQVTSGCAWQEGVYVAGRSLP